MSSFADLCFTTYLEYSFFISDFADQFQFVSVQKWLLKYDLHDNTSDDEDESQAVVRMGPNKRDALLTVLWAVRNSED